VGDILFTAGMVCHEFQNLVKMTGIKGFLEAILPTLLFQGTEKVCLNNVLDVLKDINWLHEGKVRPVTRLQGSEIQVLPPVMRIQVGRLKNTREL